MRDSGNEGIRREVPHSLSDNPPHFLFSVFCFCLLLNHASVVINLPDMILEMAVEVSDEGGARHGTGADRYIENFIELGIGQL